MVYCLSAIVLIVIVRENKPRLKKKKKNILVSFLLTLSTFVTLIRGAFRNLPKIHDGVFLSLAVNYLRKEAPPQIFDKVLTTRLLI